MRDAGGIQQANVLEGYIGRWLCESLPVTVELTDQAICRRFLHKSVYSDNDDYRFSAGESLYVQRFIESHGAIYGETVTVAGAT